MKLTSALFAPASDVPAASASGTPAGAQAGGADAASQPGSALTTAQIFDAFVGEESKPIEKAGTPKPPGPSGASTKKDANTPAGGDAENEETPAPKAGEEEEEEEQEDDGATAGDHKPKPLDSLIEAVLTDVDAEGSPNKESAAYKRMEKLLAKPAELQRLLDEANAKVADSEGPPIVVAKATAADPLGHIANETQFEQETARATAASENADRWIEWCTDNPEGGIPDGAKDELSREQVKQTLANARDAKRYADAVLKAAPAREKYLKDLGETREALRKSHPEIFKKGSPELAECVKLIQEGVISTRHPTYMRDALDLIEGRKARQEREAGTVTVKLNPKAAAAKAGAANGEGTGTSSTGSTGSARPGPSGKTGSGRTPATRAAGARVDVPALREQAAKGSIEAKGALIDAFANL